MGKTPYLCVYICQLSSTEKSSTFLLIVPVGVVNVCFSGTICKTPKIYAKKINFAPENGAFIPMATQSTVALETHTYLQLQDLIKAPNSSGTASGFPPIRPMASLGCRQKTTLSPLVRLHSLSKKVEQTCARTRAEAAALHWFTGRITKK